MAKKGGILEIYEALKQKKSAPSDALNRLEDLKNPYAKSDKKKRLTPSEREEVIFQLTDNLGLYSKLEEVALNIPQETQRADDLLSYFRSQNVKGAELEEMGLLDFLKSKKGDRVTKEEVIRVLDRNVITLKEEKGRLLDDADGRVRERSYDISFSPETISFEEYYGDVDISDHFMWDWYVSIDDLERLGDLSGTGLPPSEAADAVAETRAKIRNLLEKISIIDLGVDNVDDLDVLGGGELLEEIIVRRFKESHEGQELIEEDIRNRYDRDPAERLALMDDEDNVVFGRFSADGKIFSFPYEYIKEPKIEGDGDGEIIFSGFNYGSVRNNETGATVPYGDPIRRHRNWQSALDAATPDSYLIGDSPEDLAELRVQAIGAARANGDIEDTDDGYGPREGTINWPEETLDGGTNYQEFRVLAENTGRRGPSQLFHEGIHFDDDWNRLFHVRTKDRVVSGTTEADDKKVLYIEELQSDWGQAGRKSGFKDEKKLEAAEKKLYERDQALLSLVEEPGDRGLLDLINLKKSGWHRVPSDDLAPRFRSFDQITVRLTDFVRDLGVTDIARSSPRSGYTPFDGFTTQAIGLVRSVKVLRDTWPGSQSDLDAMFLDRGIDPKAFDLLESFVKKYGSAKEDLMQEQWRVPRHELIRDTQAYTDLAMKYVFNKAAREGYDAVAFAPGIVHAERWGKDPAQMQVYYDEMIPASISNVGAAPAPEPVTKGSNRPPPETITVDGYTSVLYSLDDVNKRGNTVRDEMKSPNTMFAVPPVVLAGGVAALASPGEAEAGPLRKGISEQRLERAKKLGFDADNVMYHASKQDIYEFVPGYPDGLVFLTPNKEFANNWLGKGKFQERQGGTGAIEGVKAERERFREEANKILEFLPKDQRQQYYEEVLFPQDQQLSRDIQESDRVIYPVVTKAKKPFVPHKDYEVLEELIGKERMDSPLSADFPQLRDGYKSGNYLLYENSEVVEFLRSKGFDSMFLQESPSKTDTESPEYSTFAVFDPTDIRSVNAEFDPKKLSSPNILASGLAAATGIAALSPGEAEAMQKTIERVERDFPGFSADILTGAGDGLTGAKEVVLDLLGDLASPLGRASAPALLESLSQDPLTAEQIKEAAERGASFFDYKIKTPTGKRYREAVTTGVESLFDYLSESGGSLDPVQFGFQKGVIPVLEALAPVAEAYVEGALDLDAFIRDEEDRKREKALRKSAEPLVRVLSPI